jgi:NADPH:quinone reductase-like Zn-dependent oxidoreductase
MKAVVIVRGGQGGTLELRDVPEPRPQAGQLLIRVKATALSKR